MRQSLYLFCIQRFLQHPFHVLWGFKKQNTVYAIGKSILKRDSKVNVGELALKYGGGGHQNAGTCQIDTPVAPETLKELVAFITKAG